MNQIYYKKTKLFFVAQHPVDYHIGIYREFANNNSIETFVIYESRIGLEDFFENEFKTIIPKKNNLLDGYDYKIFKNYGTNAASGIFSRINPGIFLYILKNKPDYIIIHGYSTLTDLFLIFFSKLINIKIIIKGEAVIQNHANNMKEFVKKVLLKKILIYSNFVLYSSNKNKEFWRKYGCRLEKCIPFICSVDNDRFRKDYNLKKTVKNELINKIIPFEYINLIRILVVGRLTKRKNPIHLLKAVESSIKEKVLLIFVGSGEEKENIESYAKDKEIKILLAGFIENGNIGEYYAISDIFVNLSEYDPSPKTINEAMNYCLPIIASSSVGTLEEMVVNGYNGYSYKVGNIQELRERIILMISEKDNLKKMGENSNILVTEYNYAKNMMKLLEAINEA